MAKNDKKESLKAPDNGDTVSIVTDTEKKSVQKNDKPRKFRGKTAFILAIIAVVGGYEVYRYESLQTQTANETALIGQYAKKIQNLEAEIQKLNADFVQLKNTQAAKNSALSEEISQKATALRDEFNTLISAKDALTAKTTPADEHIDTAEKNNEAEIKTIKQVPADILLASGAMIIREMAENGQSFEYEAEVLQILAEDNDTARKYVDIIRKYADTGIGGRSMLINEFNALYADLSKPHKANKIAEKSSDKQDNGWQQRLKNYAENLVKLRKSAPNIMIEPQENDEIPNLINQGKFAEALNKIKTDGRFERTNSQALHEWIRQTENYLDFNSAVNGLVMNSLANIRIKGLL
jgi:cell division protein FtsB